MTLKIPVIFSYVHYLTFIFIGFCCINFIVKNYCSPVLLKRFFVIFPYFGSLEFQLFLISDRLICDLKFIEMSWKKTNQSSMFSLRSNTEYIVLELIIKRDGEQFSKFIKKCI